MIKLIGIIIYLIQFINYIKFNLEKIIKNIRETSYLVNIGCSDGITGDPLNLFVKNKHYKGLYIDGSEENCNLCRNNIINNFIVLNTFVNPNNISNIFIENNVPKNMDVLKVDIDGYDLALMREIINEGYKPKIIISEINEKIPPPIKFEVKYNDTYKWDVSHFFGYSLASAKDFFEKNDYFIVSLYDKNNVLCIHKSYINLIDEFKDLKLPININNLYREGYFNYRHEFPWNNDVKEWLYLWQIWEKRGETEEDRDKIKQSIINYYRTGSNDEAINNNKKYGWGYLKREYIDDEDYIIN